MAEPKHITVTGARVHNLKNICVEIPKNRFVVITGKSGSGKSSLAFDTIYAEGQRRYVESLSSYARQFLEQMQKPDVDAIEGLAPAIAIDQRTVGSNPRSTVATITEIYDYLRVLFARAGTPYCYSCGREITSQTVQEMVDRITALPAGEKIMVLAPVVQGRRGEFARELNKLQKEGFVRARIDGTIADLAAAPPLAKNKRHTIDLVVDRLVVKSGIEKRLADSLQTALQFGGGIALIAPAGAEEMCFNEQLSCVRCGIGFPDVSPRTFSFNSPYGACPACSGLGTRIEFDPALVVPDKSLSINNGAIVPWGERDSFYVKHLLGSVARHYGFSLDTPYRQLDESVQSLLMSGSGRDAVELVYQNDAGTKTYKALKPFEGVLASLHRRYHTTESEKIREDLSRYMNRQPCPECGGSRLRKESLAVKIGGASIHDIVTMTVAEAGHMIRGLSFTGSRAAIAGPLLKEITGRLGYLRHLGLGYLGLDRTGATLSGGEAHRIRLATQLGTRLTGVLYVLDEPSIGLHARDTGRLIDTLKDLRDIGNTIIVVEHDRDTILASDYCIDLGPGAGTEGGRVVAAGTPKQLMKNSASRTGRYIAGRCDAPVPLRRRQAGRARITLRGASENNLNHIDISFPLGLFICTTGVSGSGKSTLVLDTLYPALANRLYRSAARHGAITAISGIENVDKVIHVDQSPIGRTPRSNPATFTGLFAPIRDIFSQLPESKLRGYRPGRFSFNVKGGRCEACQGDGLVKIEMHFLPDIFVTCDVCRGRRYNRETLEIMHKGRSIADVLDMTVREALPFFENIPLVRGKLQVLHDVGLDYITLGQQATTLSGGEAQRIKLARELSKKDRGHTVYILDEPTTGLHYDDVCRLLEVLHSLVERSNTVIVIEHNMDVISTADYIIDMGPEGGDRGGMVVAAGTPEDIAKNEASHTGRYLKEYLGRN